MANGSYIGKIGTQSAQFVKAPISSKVGKKPAKETGGDLRANKGGKK